MNDLVGISYYLILVFLAVVLIFSIIKKVDAYDSFLDGCKISMKDGIILFPYILVMYVAVNVFRASVFLEDILPMKKITNDLIMQGVFRPVSSHASLSMMISIINDFGVDSNEGFISAILQGGSDTTMYVMGLYFGYAGIKKTRYAYVVGIICDLLIFILCMAIYFFFL